MLSADGRLSDIFSKHPLSSVSHHVYKCEVFINIQIFTYNVFIYKYVKIAIQKIYIEYAYNIYKYRNYIF